MTEKPRFALRQKVKIVSDDPKNAYVYGRVASVMQRTRDDNGRWLYWVDVWYLDRAWRLRQDELADASH